MYYVKIWHLDILVFNSNSGCVCAVFEILAVEKWWETICLESWVLDSSRSL